MSEPVSASVMALKESVASAGACCPGDVLALCVQQHPAHTRQTSRRLQSVGLGMRLRAPRASRESMREAPAGRARKSTRSVTREVSSQAGERDAPTTVTVRSRAGCDQRCLAVRLPQALVVLR